MESEREERRIKEYRMSEKKENKLEGEILMNRKLKQKLDKEEDVMKRNSVYSGEEDIRINFMRKKWINKKGI